MNSLCQEEMEHDVNPNDHFVFRLHQEPKFVDIALRDRAESVFTSELPTVPPDLRDYYGGCPFSAATLDLCHACHIIPRVKEDDVCYDLVVTIDN